MKMQRFAIVTAGLVGLSLAGRAQSPLALEEAFEQGSAAALAAAAAPRTRTRSEFAAGKIPVRVESCSDPRYYKDPLERQRVAMDFSATYCREKVTFEEREDGTEGRGFFKRPKWVRVPGSETTTYEYATQREEIDLSYDPDSFRTRERILEDLRDACRGTREKLIRRALEERANVRCK